MDGYFVERTSDKLEHHGILGMKWGIRRYQSYDTVPRGSGKGGKEIGAARGSLKGNAYRALGKVYSLNEKTYNKLGNKTLASMNSAAKNRMNAAATMADKVAYEKKAGRIEKKYAKDISKSEKATQKMMDKRASNREKIESKYDKKIAKTEADIKSYDPIKEGLKDSKGRDILTKQDVDSMVSELNKRIEKYNSQKEAHLQDFDAGSKYVEQGFKTYTDIISKYKDAKIGAIDNKIFKGSPEYKEAVQAYTNQVLLNQMYGKMGTRLGYTTDLARKGENVKGATNRYLTRSVYDRL